MSLAQIESTERVKKLRAQVLHTPELCLERGSLMTASYKETEGEPEVIRRAKALSKILNEMTIGIEDGELIVGRTTSKLRGAIVAPEIDAQWYLREMDTFATRKWNKYAPLNSAEKNSLREFLPYWQGKSIYDKVCKTIPPELLKLHHVVFEGGGHSPNNIYQGHSSVDYAMVLNGGLQRIKNKVIQEIATLDLACIDDFTKYQFLRAVEITLGAAISFARRYAALARTMAVKEKNKKRKEELERIAAVCTQVPEHPAHDFYEAMQAMWLTYVVVMIEGPGYGIGFGRPDQFLYPFFKKDLDEGKITRGEVVELISLFYIKVNCSVIPVCLAAARTFGGHPLTANITLGGIKPDGKDAVNELSYLFLEAEKNAGLSGEDLIVRIHHDNPDDFVMKACDVAKSLHGKLKFLSDETTIKQLMNDGKPETYARDYSITGCNTPSVPGVSQDVAGGLFNLPLMLELALNNGVSHLSGEEIGPRTGDPRNFRTYEDIWNAYKKQVETLLPAAAIFRNVDDSYFAELAPVPFQSALFQGCIEHGIDIQKGGTMPFFNHGISLSGSPNVGDSLAVIKKAVFEDKIISMAELLDAIDRNFVGKEAIIKIINRIPKFGNDEDYVDTIVNEVLEHGSRIINQYKGIAGSISSAAAGIVTGDVPMGEVVGALPDGRKAGQPLAEGGISPYQGRNVSGPVATLRSVAKINHLKITGGSVLNMRFNPDVVKDEQKMHKFVMMLRTFLETGGALIQFNFIDTKTLRDAQQYPNKYRDLLVRVATYSAYFVELSPDLQNDIIARIEFSGM